MALAPVFTVVSRWVGTRLDDAEIDDDGTGEKDAPTHRLGAARSGAAIQAVSIAQRGPDGRQMQRRQRIESVAMLSHVAKLWCVWAGVQPQQVTCTPSTCLSMLHTHTWYARTTPKCQFRFQFSPKAAASPNSPALTFVASVSSAATHLHHLA